MGEIPIEKGPGQIERTELFVDGASESILASTIRILAGRVEDGEKGVGAELIILGDAMNNLGK
jgi:hypothetical protein